MPTDYIIEVKNVWKSFKTVQAVKGVDIKIPKGQFVALLGPNGAGKTTLVEMIEGIQKPDSGEITIIGKKWKGNEDELHQIIGLSLQETRFIDKLRVSETLLLFASFFNLGKVRVDEIIDIIGLEEKRKSYIVNLSGGQRQRLAIGIALINKPAILLLDEPTTGLDQNARREIWKILRGLKEKSGTSMILTTHYMEEAENLCDYIIIMDNGVILKEGTLEQLLEDVPFRVEHRYKTLDDLFVSLTGRKINEYTIQIQSTLATYILTLPRNNTGARRPFLGYTLPYSYVARSGTCFYKKSRCGKKSSNNKYT